MDLSVQILVFISLLIAVAKVVGGLSARLGLPVVLGELLAGVLLGPTAINIWKFSWFVQTGPPGSQGSLPALVQILAELGVVVLMFLAGLETDIPLMRATIGPAFWSATGGVLLPVAGAAFLGRLAGLSWGTSLFLGAILAATSVSITAQTLMQLGQIRSRAGSTILGAAVIDDVLGLIVLSVVVALQQKTASGGVETAWMALSGGVLLRLTAFCVAVFFLGPPLVRWTFRQTRHLRAHHAPVAVGLVLGFAFAFLAEHFGGLAAITGAYLAGLFTAATPAQKEILGDLQSMTNSFFGPLFFVSIGLAINVRSGLGGAGLFLLALGIAIFGKIAGCGMGSWLSGFGLRESLAVGVGMVPRGEVGLIAASIGWAKGLISPEIYSLAVVLVLVTSLIMPASLRAFFPMSHSFAISPHPSSNKSLALNQEAE